MKTKYDVGQEVYFAPYMNVNYIQYGRIDEITINVKKEIIYHIYVRDYVYYDVKEKEIIDDINEIKTRLRKEARDSYKLRMEQIKNL